MRLPLSLLLALLVHESLVYAKPAKRQYSTHDYYVLEHVPLAGASLDECARELGVEVVERAGELANHWLVRTTKPDSSLSTRDSGDRVMRRFQQIQERAASSLSSRSEDVRHSRRVASSLRYLEPQVLRKRVKRAPPPIPGPNAVGAESSSSIAQRLKIVDPEFGRQWHLVNDDYPQHMMNVTRVWEMGITGKGVISALVDDGLDYNSDDLAANFYAEGSYDYNDHTDLPTPALFDDHHGTRCAGQIAAGRNNVCGVGIAYESKVAGLRILSGPISDVDEAAALNYGYQNSSIYSCSWGPPDNGRAMEGPGYLIKKAILNGIQHGRGGLGSVFVFASGNGGRNGDQCNFDGYTNSIFSVTVASVDYKGLHPDYSEACAANMIVAYSSGSGNHITTTDIGKNRCAHSHGGTSAAAPNAAGVFALALSVRPDLSWRDIQHLCVQTAFRINPEDPDWERTATGRYFSYKYGYGSLNGYEFVKAAQEWKTVKPQAFIEAPVVQVNNGTMDLFRESSGGSFIISGGISSEMEITQAMLNDNNFEKLEHITIKVWITHSRRGDVEVELVSPNGIRSVLAGKRYQDSDNTGFPGWTFMTVKHWDENPLGKWTIRVSDQEKEDESGVFLGWTMTLWGSVIDATKAKLYDIPLVEGLLPPLAANEPSHPSVSSSVLASSTKTHTKPTAHLPGDHGSAPGEADKPSFPGKPTGGTAQPSGSPSPTPDSGWFAELGNLVTNQMWLFLAIGVVIVFSAGVGFYLYRRQVNRRKDYASLPTGDDVPMGSVGRRAGPRTKELYDAFGEMSDEEDADESTVLRSVRPQDMSPGGFQSRFLDDDDPTTGGRTPATRYKDEPEQQPKASGSGSHQPTEPERPHSPAGSGGSGDGSWEHASETR